MLFLSKTCIALLGASLLSLVVANPIAEDRGERGNSRRRAPQNTDPSKASLPNSGLEAPASGLVLKSLLLGIGTQNYTCDSANPSKPPVAMGAVAELHDAASVSWTEQSIKGMTIAAFYSGRTHLPSAGKHYFNGGTPIFDLGDKGFFSAKKLGGVPAPAGSVPQSEKAVDWLKLGDNGASRGFKEVYRVFTNGGKAPATCENQPDRIEVKYTTNYYFFG